jgi:WD40 repeat protein
LASLARRNALRVRHESFRADADRLLAAIEPILRPSASEVPVSSGPARAVAPPTTATEPEPTATASKAETTTSASVRPDTGWSSTQVRTFQHPSTRGLLFKKTVFGVAFSPDSRWLATSDDKTVRIWDASSGGQLHTLAHDDGVWAVVFSPDGRWLATASNPALAAGSEGKTVRIWDAGSGGQLRTLAHDDGVHAVAFSPDGRWLATGTEGNRAVLWRLTPPSYH